MIAKERWFWCGTCNYAAIRCDVCHNTSCNGSGCSECDADFEEIMTISKNDRPKKEEVPFVPCEMDRILRSVAKPVNLFQSGEFVLSSGAKSGFKIDCDALTDTDIETLAAIGARIAGPFRTVEGIPTGGIRLAKALERHITKTDESWATQYHHVIVDDVLTSSKSMKLAFENWQKVAVKGGWVTGLVIFARGPCPDWIKPIFQMSNGFWEKTI